MSYRSTSAMNSRLAKWLPFAFRRPQAAVFRNGRGRGARADASSCRLPYACGSRPPSARSVESPHARPARPRSRYSATAGIAQADARAVRDALLVWIRTPCRTGSASGASRARRSWPICASSSASRCSQRGPRRSGDFDGARPGLSRTFYAGRQSACFRMAASAGICFQVPRTRRLCSGEAGCQKVKVVTRGPWDFREGVVVDDDRAKHAFADRPVTLRQPGNGRRLKKPAKTREELEAAIRLEMEDISELPTDLAISVVPHEDTRKVTIITDGPQDAGRTDIIAAIADRLRSQFDLEG